MVKESIKTLEDIEEGSKVMISSLDCGSEMKHRLCCLGISCGQCVKMVKNDVKGPLILKVLDSKIVIGRGQARKISVRYE